LTITGVGAGGDRAADAAADAAGELAEGDAAGGALAADPNGSSDGDATEPDGPHAASVVRQLARVTASKRFIPRSFYRPDQDR
jgi:hypothetical protein